MDTTTEVAPFRLLSFNIRKKQGLVIPVSGVPHLEETPADPPMANSQVETIDCSANELGKLTAKVNYVVRGDTELLMRIIFRRVPNAQWQHLVEHTYSLGWLDGEVTEPQSGRSGSHDRSFSVFLRDLESELPGLVQEEIRN